MKLARFVLPAIAVVALVGTACTPVKPQFGRNILAFSVTDGCVPGLPNNEPANRFWSPSNNFSRQVCGEGRAFHTVGADGVTLQIVNAAGASPPGQFGASVGFAIGGIYNLGAINTIGITKSAGSADLIVSLILDRNGDGKFLATPPATGFAGDAIVTFADSINGDGGQRFFFDNDTTIPFYAPCAGGLFGTCSHDGPPGLNFPFTTLAQLKQGFHPMIDGNTRTLIYVETQTDTNTRATVTGVEVNGTQLLP